MPKLSIILPVYNSEKYLSQCIDSVISQSFADFELIIINDGSTDSSGEICNVYAEKDNRIKVIHQNNRGVSFARKLGIEQSDSEWLGFIDSDDWIESDTLKIAYDTAIKEESDIVCFGIQKATQTEKTSIEFFNSDIYTNFLYYPVYMNSFCNKIIKKALFTENSLDFGIGIITSEDLLVMFQLFHFAKKISYLPSVLYNYRFNSDSVTQTILSEKKVLSDCMVAQKQYLFCKEHNTLKKAKSYLLHRNFYAALPFIWNKSLFNPQKYRQYTIYWNCFSCYSFNLLYSFLSICVFLHLDFIPKILLTIKDNRTSL